MWLAWCVLSLTLAACGGSDGGNAPVAPSITTQPANASVNEAQVASFTVAATGSDPIAYQWRKNGTAIAGATAASYTTPATVLADSGALFTVVVSNAAGSVPSNAATLTVGAVVAPPVITTQPTATSVVAPATATFTVVATGGGTLIYQWKRGGTAIAGATAASYTTPATTVAADNGAIFAVTVTNSASTATSDNASLTVTAAPIAAFVATQPQNTTVTAGQTASFSVVAGGTAPFTYQWSKNGTAIAGATAASYTTPVTVDADIGSTFRVVIGNSVGQVTSADATLTVTQAPVMPAITSQPSSVSVTAGQAASFSVTAAGTPTLTYQWYRGATAIAGATSATYVLASTAAADNGAQFSVVVGNVAGSVRSNAATLTVGTAATAPTIATAPAPMTVTTPASATFGVVANGTAPLAYQWRRNGVAISGANAASYTTPATTVAADNGAQFSVVVSNGTLPNATSPNALLTVLAAPVAPTIATPPANATVNVGSTATFSVVANGSAPLAYQWRRNGTPIAGATGSAYTTAATVAGDNGATFSVVVSNGTLPNATSADATLTVNLVWTGIRQDGAPFPVTGSLPIAIDGGRAIATDAQGNVIIGGYTSGIFTAGTDPGAIKPFIAKYNAAGSLVWVRLVLDAYNGFGVAEFVAGLAVDSAGNIYVTGQTLTTLAGEVAAGGTDVFVAKFDADGTRLWAHQLGSTQNDTSNGIAVDASGNAFVVGTTFGQLPLQAPPGGTSSYFIAKYTSDGSRAWVVEDAFNAAHSGPYNEGNGVAVDAAGNAYVAGRMSASQSGGSGAYVAKFNGSGARQWETQLAGAAPNNGLPVAADAVALSSDGSSVYLSGRTYADFDVAGNPSTVVGDAFVARFNGSGALQWVHNLSSQTLSGPRYFDDEAFGIATNAAGSAVFITGYTNGVMPGEASKGAEDAFIARYEADGTRTWVRQFGSSVPASRSTALNDRAFGIALDLHGDVFVTGVTHGSFGTPGRNTDRDDWFVLKVRPADGSLY